MLQPPEVRAEQFESVYDLPEVDKNCRNIENTLYRQLAVSE